MISRSTIQRVANIKKTTAEVKDTFQKFNEAMQKKMKSFSEDGFIGDKPTPAIGQTLLRTIAIFAKNLNASTIMMKSLRLMMNTTHLMSLKIHI